MRESESKQIVNQEMFEATLSGYQHIINRLTSKYTVVDGSQFENLVNFKTNLTLRKHKWYDYKQGYSERLVKYIIDKEQPSHDYFILDPFCGVGTTNLTSIDK